MFTSDSMRGTSLDDTRIFRPVMRKQRCKVFFRVWSTDPSPTQGPSPKPLHKGGEYNLLFDVGISQL